MNRKAFFTRALTGATALSLAPLKGIGKVLDPMSSTWDSLEAFDLSNWPAIRDLFPLTRDRLYLNTGGLGPPSWPVLRAIQKQTELQAEWGETYHSLFDQVRLTAARFFHADTEEIAFNRSASEGNSIIAAGLEMRPGDEVIFESHAHPGGSFPWMVRQKEEGIRVRIFEPDTLTPENNLDRIFDLVNPRTRAIQVSHLTAPTGIRFDTGAIAREARKRGIWFHVDGAQSAGMIPVNLHEMGCDSYATSGHKWLNGPQESGILYIAANRLEEIACRHAGAHSNEHYELPDAFTYNPTAQRHEYGTRNAATISGLESALILQELIGLERIARHGKFLANCSRMALSDIPGLEILTPSHPEMHQAMITFRLKGRDGKDVAHELSTAHNCRCREVSERGLNAVRVSWHVYHQEGDVEELVSSVRLIADRGSPAFIRSLPRSSQPPPPLPGAMS